MPDPPFSFISRAYRCRDDLIEAGGRSCAQIAMNFHDLDCVITII